MSNLKPFPRTSDEIGESTFITIIILFACAVGCMVAGFLAADAWNHLTKLG